MTLLRAPEFNYSPLPSSNSIRLLRIHRTRDGVLPSLCGFPLIHCSLHVVDLSSDSAPTYEALSYTWDSPETENQKRENDIWKDPYGPLCRWPVAIRSGVTGEQAVLYVRKNLFEALLHLQSMNDVDEKGKYGHTKLHDAAEIGDVDAVRSLLEQGASCGARDYFGETPLHYAAENGFYEAVKVLVASGSDMSVYDNMGRSPVQCCVQRKRGEWEKTARFLRDWEFRSQELRSVNGGDPDLEARSEPLLKTPLIQASEDGDLALVQNLIRKGANLSAQAKFGKTGLHHAAGNGYYDIVKELVRAGASQEILDLEGRTPLTCCMQMKKRQWKEISRFLQDPSFRHEELTRSAPIENEAHPNWEGTASGFFWIDAICINQDDLEERSAQVAIMPQIYSKADCVIVWLGDDSQMIFRLLKNQWMRPDLKKVINGVNKKASKLKKLEKQWSISLREFLIDKVLDWILPDGGLFTINDIKLILSCFLRSWFTRVWCIQELTLARKIRMFLGKTELDWHNVLKFLCLLAHLGFFRGSSLWKMDKGWVMQDGKGGDGSEAWRLAEIRLRTADNSDEWAIVDPILHRKECQAPHVRRADRLSLPLLLAATWSFESKDPRDKIYAILSLAAPLPPEDQIVIDYTSPVENLYIQIAHIFLRGSGRDSMYIQGDALIGILEPLEGLSYVQDPYYSGQQAKMPGLPSWAPDFSTPLTTHRIWRRAFGAAKALEPKFSPGNDKGTLEVLAAEVDTVDLVEPGWADLDPDDMPADLEVDIKSWFDLLETMEPINDESPVQMLFRTLCVDKLWKDCDEETRDRGAASFRDFLAWELACHIRNALEEIRKKKIEDEAVDCPSDNQVVPQSDEYSSEASSDTESSDGWGVCDGCDRGLIAGDWHCEDCEDFDFCWRCFRDAKATHDSRHHFIVLPIAPTEESNLSQEEAPSRLIRLFSARNAGSKQSLLPHYGLGKSADTLSRWFSHDAQVLGDSKTSQFSVKDDEDTLQITNKNDDDEPAPFDSVSGLEASLANALNHQRILEKAHNSGKRRFIPSNNEIPAQNKLTSTWNWCKYHGDEAACKDVDDEASFRFQMVQVYRKRCLFRTKAGRLGLGPQSVKPGDTVCLVAGTRTPYILRKKDQNQQAINRFKFLGEAYVHGIMYWEETSVLTKYGLAKIHLE